MDCPTCGGDTGVLNTRAREGGYVYRRRKCVRCGDRFSTREVPLDYIRPVVDRDAIRDALAAAERSILKACADPGEIVRLTPVGEDAAPGTIVGVDKG